jgi:zinc transport system substrate-binding protein
MKGFILHLLLGTLVIAAVIHSPAGTAECSTRLKVAASIFPLAHFAEKAGGELVDVKLIMSAGNDPHTFEPGPSDLRAVYGAEVFIFHGAGLDSWAERIEKDLVKNGIITVEISKMPPFDSSLASGDPHDWLDPVLAMREVEIIRDALAGADPANADIYKRNAAAYKAFLQRLDEEFRSSLRECGKRDIIVTHNAFGYLASRYGIRIHSIMGLTTEEEPSARRLVKIIRLARRLGIKFIFYEKLVSPRYAKMVAEETGGSLLVLDPAATLTREEMAEDVSYLSIMRGNLEVLKKAMECK